MADRARHAAALSRAIEALRNVDSLRSDLATCHDVLGEANSLIDPEAYPEVTARIEAALTDCSNPVCWAKKEAEADRDAYQLAATTIKAERDRWLTVIEGHREWLQAKSHESDNLATNIRASRASGGWHGVVTWDHAIAAFGAFEKALAHLDAAMKETKQMGER